MSVVNTVKEFLTASTESPNRGSAADEQSAGAYWCHDCSERIRDVEVSGESPPDCPECGDEMDLERSPDSTGCAC
jgi:Zn finger protein HypA/HybF involved in hydrogenase expression